MKKRVLSMLLVFVMLISLIPASAISAFAADGETSLVIVKQNNPETPISTLTLMPGEMINLKACIKNPDGTLELINFGATWKSSAQEIASVTASGMVTAQNEGMTEIYAIYNDLVATLTLRVGMMGNEVILEPVDEQGNVCYSKDVFVGDSFNLSVNAYINGEYIENVLVEWRVDEFGILDNYGDGSFKASASGTAPVRAFYMSDDGNEYAVDITVNVSDAPAVEDTVVKYAAVKMEGTPKVGSTPFYDATIEATGCSLFTPDDPTYNGYVQNGIMWVDVTTSPSRKMAPTDTFEEDHMYSIALFILADEGYEINWPETQVTFNQMAANNTGYLDGYADTEAFIRYAVRAYKVNEEADICTFDLTNCYATDSQGNVITSATPGDTVRIVRTSPSLSHSFNGWIVEPEVEYTEENINVITFTAINGTVKVTADYEPIATEFIYVYAGHGFMVGDEIPFVAETHNGQMYYSGYYLGAPDEMVNANMYNYVEWYDNTDYEYKKPGDVFEADHEYSLYVSVVAADYYYFPENNLVTVKFGGIGDGTVYDYWPYGTVDASRYTQVGIGDIKPIKEYNISLKNAIAYDADGNAITKAKAGDSVRIVFSEPFFGHGDFLGWTVEPAGLEYTTQYGVHYFTMPESDVSFTAEFADTDCSYVYLNVGGNFKEGDEIPFSVITNDGQIYHNGYNIAMPNGADKTDVYSNIKWYDSTSDEFKQPGGVFERNHTYIAYVGIAAAEYYSFTDVAELKVNFAYFGAGSATAYGEIGANAKKWLIAESPVITPIPAKDINVTNGVAYNADGEVITWAHPGETVTVVAMDDTGVQTFIGWYDKDYTGDITFADSSSETTTFVMPDRAVNVVAGYSPRGIGFIDFELDGYYQTNRADKMTLAAHGDGFFVVPYDEYTPYQVYLDNYGAPNSFAFDGRFYYAYYWLRVELYANDGYVFTVEDGDTFVAVNGMIYSDSIIEYGEDGKSVVLYYMIEAPEYVATNSIYVYGGIATQYGDEVYEAVPGAKIYLIPDESTDEQIFDKWISYNTDVELITTDDGFTYFIMPDSYVTVEAKWKGAINSIYINDIDFPVAGESPDYTATEYTEDGYDIILRDDYGWINGVSWSEMIDGDGLEKLDPETAVFEEGKTYVVSFCIEALDGYWFPVNEYGVTTVSAFINGSYATVTMYTEDVSKTVSVAIEYTVPKSYSITVEGGNAYDPRGNASGAPTGGDGDPIYSAFPGTYVKVVADVPAGYEFSYWEIVEGPFKIDEESLKNSIFWFDMPESDIVLRAHFTLHEEHEWDENAYCYCGAKGYGVTFSWAPGDQIFGYIVVENGYASEPAEPAQDDMVFLGWYTAEGNKFDFDTPITADIELIATFEPVGDVTLGDIDGDGSINGKDSNLLKQFISGSAMPDETQQTAADVNCDGAINGIDANLLAQFLAGAIGGF